jgi:hypothetical protein
MRHLQITQLLLAAVLITAVSTKFPDAGKSLEIGERPGGERPECLCANGREILVASGTTLDVPRAVPI